MTPSKDEHQQPDHSDNPAQQEGAKTPLEAVREQQAAMQKNREVAEQRNEPSPEVPGASSPSTRRHHPQRQMYGSGTNES